MLIYSGLGLLGVPLYLASFGAYFFALLFLGFWDTNGNFFADNFWKIAAGAFPASLIVFVFGKFVNRNPAFQEVVTKNGRQLKPFTSHTLFHIPVEFSGLLITVAAIFAYFFRNFL